MPNDSCGTPLQKTAITNLNNLAALLGNPLDLKIGLYGSGRSCGIAYLESLVDEDDIKTNLLRPLLSILTEPGMSPEKITALLPQTGSRKLLDLEAAAAALSEGQTVVFLDKGSEALSFSIPGWAKHPLQEPRGERAIRGPREGFTETISENIGMIRRWISDCRLRADHLRIGRRTRTNIAVMYLEDVAQPRLVREVKKRITAIDIDGIVDSGYLELLIKDCRTSLFPMTQSTERTDKVTAAILEGRVAILVDKSPFVIIVPVTLNELYQASEDYYIDVWLAGVTRLIRLFGTILAVGLPGLYVAFVSVNPELLPTQFALTIASSRSNAILPLPFEVFILEVLVGIFYEAGIRLPGTLSQTIGITFGVIMGLVGTLSGLVSPVTLIIVSITAIASYVGPNYAMGLVWRVLKYIMLLAASLFGFFGLTIAGVLILGHAANLNSFGVSLMAPWAPLEWPELADAPVRIPFWARWNRPRTYRPQDRLRSGGTKREDHEND